MDFYLIEEISIIYKNYEKINKKIHNDLFEYLTKASELVELSNDLYQIEKSIKLNKISLKDYILNSNCCLSLSSNNVRNYSLEELKKYLYDYEKISGDNCSSYFLAVSLFELLEEIENNVDQKINMEMDLLNKINNNIKEIKESNVNYEQLYSKIDLEIKNDYSQKIDVYSFKIIKILLDDIFDFYINGYPRINSGE